MSPVEITRADLERARAIARNDDELESVACEALVLAARAFDGRGTWSGYSGQRMSWAVANERKRLHRIRSRETASEGLETLEVVPVPTDLPNRVTGALQGLTEAQRDALLNGPEDMRLKDYRDAVTTMRQLLGVAGAR